MTTYHADHTAIRLLQFILIITAVIFSLAAKHFLSPYPTLMHIICTVVLGTALVFGFLCLPLYLHSIRCIVTSAQITLKSGIFIKQEQSVRLQNIQFVRIVHGPANGAYGLNFIILHLYGGKLILPFLSRKDRIKLTDFLRKKGVFHAP